MTTFQNAATTWRDKEVDGVYSSADHDPIKAEIRAWAAWVESGLNAGTLNGPWEATLAALNAKLAYGDGNPGFVYAGADIGTYRKSGASGAGSWVKIFSFIPGHQFVKATDAGAGTANAIIATSSPPVSYTDGAQTILANISTTNTATTVTINFDGLGALAVKTASGADPAIGSLTANMVVRGTIQNSATEFRLDSNLSQYANFDHQGTWDGVTTYTENQIVTGSNGFWYQLKASSAFNDDPVSGGSGDWLQILSLSAALPAIEADSMLVSNAGGTAREEKTFAEVRGLLDVPAYADLLYIDGMANGLTGNSGEDQTTALQDIVDNVVPAEGGVLKYRGYVDFTTLDLSGRRNIVFQGEGGNGAGAAQRSILKSTSGAIGSGVPAIKAWGTYGIGFEKTMLLAQDAAFNGILLDFNDPSVTPGNDSALMHIRDCYMQVTSASGTALDLYGSAQGSFENTTFAGSGTHVKLQSATAVLFANQMHFRRCDFKPDGTVMPVSGSGESIMFEACNIQASSGDGKMRFIETALAQPFNNITLLGNSFYDPTAGGVLTCVFYWGNGLTIIGNKFSNYTGSYDITLGGGGSGADPQVDGLRGFTIAGNKFDSGSAHISFDGTIANKKNPRGGTIVGNSITNGALLSNYAVGEAVEVGPNSIYGSATEFGAQRSYIGLYEYANRAAAISGGLTTNQMYVETTSGERHLCIV
jgi:hypothetical protein